jgi:predicted metalloprotease with PDZ domain
MTTIVPVHLPEKKEEKEEEHPMLKMFAKNLQPVAVFSRGIGDYVFSVMQPEVTDLPNLGISFKLSEGQFKITDVKKKSIASDNGLKKGDIIEQVDGIQIKTIEQLRLLLASKNWNDSIQFGIKKKIEIKKESKE